MTKTIRLFYVYAREDEAFVADLERHLSILKRSRVVDSWHPGKLMGGDSCDEEILGHLDQADIILLLVSADFIASASCYEVQMARSMVLLGSRPPIDLPLPSR